MRNGFGVRSDILMTQLQCCSVKKTGKKRNFICWGDYMEPSTPRQVTSCGINMDDTYLPPYSPAAFPEVGNELLFFYFFLLPPTCNNSYFQTLVPRMQRGD